MSLINREDLIAEYDRVHVGPPGGARKLMVDAHEVQPDRMKLVQQAVNTIMSTCRSYSIRDRAFRNAARLVQCAIDGEATDFEQIHEGDEMPSEPRWIPVSERLPESGRYLVSCSLSVFSPQVLNYDENNGEWFYDGCKSMDFEMPAINAWMPLPEPYREEGEEHEAD